MWICFLAHSQVFNEDISKLKYMEAMRHKSDQIMKKMEDEDALRSQKERKSHECVMQHASTLWWCFSQNENFNFHKAWRNQGWSHPLHYWDKVMREVIQYWSLQEDQDWRRKSMKLLKLIFFNALTVDDKKFQGVQRLFSNKLTFEKLSKKERFQAQRLYKILRTLLYYLNLLWSLNKEVGRREAYKIERPIVLYILVSGICKVMCVRKVLFVWKVKSCVSANSIYTLWVSL